MLSPLQSFLGRVFVEDEPIIEVVHIKSFNLLIYYSILRESIVLEINLV